MSKIRAFHEHYEPATGLSTSSGNDLQFEDFDYTRYQVRIIKKAFPWLFSSAIAILLFLAVILALFYGLKLNEPAQPSSTTVPTTTYSTLKGIGKASFNLLKFCLSFL